MAEWDAEQYHRVSGPQRSWGLRVLERLQPRPGERILDIGCGTGRLTSDMRARVPSASILALDRSHAMLREAVKRADPAIPFLQADAARLPLADGLFDAVFSTATFHWVPDHPALFAEIHRVLVPGGRLVSQAGGGPNLSGLYARTADLARQDRLTDCFTDWSDPWTFAGVDDTRARLEHAGFTDIDVWLEPAPTTFANANDYRAFVTTACLRHQLARLPDRDRGAYVDALARRAARDDPPYTLDYWRLNIDARK